MDDEAATEAAHARISPVPREARPFQGQRAGIVTRLIAATLDALVIGAVLLGGYLGLVGLIFLLNPRSFTWPQLGVVFSLAAAFVVAFVYFTVFWTVSGRTYGYLVMGLRVLGIGGRRLRFFGAALRAAFVVLVPIGIVVDPVQPQQQVAAGPGPRHAGRLRLGAARRTREVSDRRHDADSGRPRNLTPPRSLGLPATGVGTSTPVVRHDPRSGSLVNLPQAFRSRTAAVVTGAAALVLAATGGGAVAAGMVTSHDIQDGTIRAVDLSDDGVNSRVIKDGSVHADDLAPAWPHRWHVPSR